MALKTERIVFTIVKDEIGNFRDLSELGLRGLAGFAQKKAKKEITKKIAGAFIPGLNYAIVGSMIINSGMYLTGCKKVTIILTLTPKTWTKVQQGHRYTFEKYSITDLDIIKN